MKKNYLLIAFTVISATVSAQNTGIGTTTPNASAMLEIKASNKGLLIPRTSTTTRTGIVNPAKGLLIYDSTVSSFWFHNGGSWVQIGASGNGWSLTGNTGTNPTTNFLGTTDAQSLLFKVNNIQAGIIDYTKANTGFGLESLLSNASGTYNCAMGTQALRDNTSGISNLAIGYEALEINNTGSGNTANGFQALVSNTAGNTNTADGFHSLFSNTAGYSNVAIGAGALYNNIDRSNQVAIGDSALFNEIFTIYNDIPGGNVAVGSKALFSNNGGMFNAAFGYQALYYNTTGLYNTACGYATLYNNIDGWYNSAYGESALYNNTTGSYNSAYGEAALINNTNGRENTAIGVVALIDNISGGENTAIGVGALSLNQTGNNNTALGYRSNVPYPGNLSNATALGANAVANSANKVRIGDVNVTVVESQVGSWTTSDGRFKNNITEDVKGLEFIKLLRPVTYNFDTKKFQEFLMQNYPDSIKQKRLTEMDKDATAKASNIVQSGFIAQDVADAVKKSGYNFNGVHAPENPTDNWSLSYEKLVVPLVKAVQEQQQQIESLKKENAEIKAQLQKLIELVSKK